MTQERRGYFRVEDKASVLISPLSDAEKELFVSELSKDQLAVGDVRALFVSLEHQFLKQLNTVDNGSFKELFELLNRKMNIIASKALMQEHDTSVYAQDPQDISLSANGLGINQTHAFPVGMGCKIELVLEPGHYYLVCYAVCVSSEPIHSSTEKGYRSAFYLETMRVNDRQHLIEHVLKLESNQLRQKKKS